MRSSAWADQKDAWGDLLRGRVLKELRKTSRGITIDALRDRLDGGATVDEEAARLVQSGDIVRVDSILFAAEVWDRIERRAREAVGTYNRKHPLRPGMPPQSLRRQLGLDGRGLGGAISALSRRGTIAVRDRGLIALPGWEPKLTSSQRDIAAAVLARLLADPLSPPRRSELFRLGLDSDLSQYLEETGAVVRIAPDILILAGALQLAKDRLRRHIQRQRTTSVAEAREAVGASQRIMLPLLEYLDIPVTEGAGDGRSPRGPAPHRPRG